MPEGATPQPLAEDLREVARGAEAVLYRARRGGADVLVKERVPKGYRHPDLDARLRRQRTRREARLLSRARERGVPCPAVVVVDERRAAIVMEFVEGPTLRALANGLQPEERRRRFLEIGRIVGELHAHGVVHGDLTTSNVIVRGEGLVVIDFGLGFHSTGVEDQAVDLHLLERSIDATHYAFAKEAFSAVKEGYALVRPRAAEVFARIAQIERRRRYSSKGE